MPQRDHIPQLKPHWDQPILPRELGWSDKTFVRHFKDVLLWICSFHLVQVGAKLTFPGQVQFLLHLHAVSLPLFCRAFYCRARFNDLLASSPLKAGNLLFPLCLRMIKNRATESLNDFRKVIPQVWRTELGLELVLSDSPPPWEGPLGHTASLQDNITCRQGQMLPVTLTIHHAHKKVQLRREILKNSPYPGG